MFFSCKVFHKLNNILTYKNSLRRQLQFRINPKIVDLATHSYGICIVFIINAWRMCTKVQHCDTTTTTLKEQRHINREREITTKETIVCKASETCNTMTNAYTQTLTIYVIIMRWRVCWWWWVVVVFFFFVGLTITLVVVVCVQCLYNILWENKLNDWNCVKWTHVINSKESKNTNSIMRR